MTNEQLSTTKYDKDQLKELMDISAPTAYQWINKIGNGYKNTITAKELIDLVNSNQIPKFRDKHIKKLIEKGVLDSKQAEEIFNTSSVATEISNNPVEDVLITPSISNENNEPVEDINMFITHSISNENNEEEEKEEEKKENEDTKEPSKEEPTDPVMDNRSKAIKIAVGITAMTVLHIFFRRRKK